MGDAKSSEEQRENEGRSVDQGRRKRRSDGATESARGGRQKRREGCAASRYVPDGVLWVGGLMDD
ncbi:hypothetical protein N7539_002428 [Penicillium diatomitis]|uniref:Uncharacterized protein n=1 Tax=Penicillium diatomitis TaxID=2819901 RepID=A0A9W9XEX6_9EURO|nr:uncharacterized protein N7539_002428 [Penicillium diatomitis]KAJ5490861.1 hypothetical protein N7539_002428 [Penicillium diatomitis]